MPRHDEMDDPGIPPPVARLAIVRAMPSSPAEPLHDALQNDLNEHRESAARANQPVLPLPSDDRVERHPRRRLLQAPLTAMTKDPICGMTVEPSSALCAERGGLMFYFCSEDCRQKFLSAPAIHPAGPCAIVIFGATVALYKLAADGFLPEDFAIIGVVLPRKWLKISRLYCNSLTRCPPRSAARTNARNKTSVGDSPHQRQRRCVSQVQARCRRAKGQHLAAAPSATRAAAGLFRELQAADRSRLSVILSPAGESQDTVRCGREFSRFNDAGPPLLGRPAGL